MSTDFAKYYHGKTDLHGVVIVEDRALIRMDTFELLNHDEKLREVIRNVIFGYAGAKNL
ncbi:MAG: hypothetical protein WA364_02555 [Candidatus Nitrosopolaris sp.]